jgi:hypothetical protein
MSGPDILGPAPRSPSRKMLPVFAGAIMVMAIWMALYFDLPNHVTITLICGTAGFLGLMLCLDAVQRFERAEQDAEQ